MLVALTDTGERIYADEVKNKNKKDKYFCPECGDELIFRKGIKNIPHFSHKHGDTICHFRKGGGESIVHQQMKRMIKQIIERDNSVFKSELEWKIGNKITDYYFEVKDRFNNFKKVAVECVYKHTDINTFREKNEYYYSNNIYCLWIFNLTKFLNKDNSFKEEVRVNEIIKESHYMNYGKIFCIDLINEYMYAIHLDKIYRERAGGYDSDGEYHDGYTECLKGTRRPNHQLIKKFEVNAFKKVFTCDWLHYSRSIAGTYLLKWWDNIE